MAAGHDEDSGPGAPGDNKAEATPEVTPRVAPTRPVPANVSNLWNWARGYIRRYKWALAPIWLTAPPQPGERAGDRCACPEGALCAAPGKHLVSGLGVARAIDDVEMVWSADDLRVSTGMVGIAVMTGEASDLMVLDVRSGGHEITRARYSVSGEVLTVQTPSGGQHWFFRLEGDEAVTGGRREVELVKEVWVLGDDAYVPLAPREGYGWVGGASVLKHRAPGAMPDALRHRLVAEGVLTSITGGTVRGSTHRDDPWRTTPGVPLAGGGVLPRTYTRLGDIRRLIDEFGHQFTWTPGLGWRVWTEGGWAGPDRSEAAIKTRIAELNKIHLRESHEAAARSADDLAKEAAKWAQKSLSRSTSSVLSDVETDERILVPRLEMWDAEGWIVGLPVRDGVGRVLDLRTGEVSADARSRRVSKMLGVDWSGEAEGYHLWTKSIWFKKFITDLTAQHGEDWVRLLQRAMGASMYGRNGVEGDLDAVFCLKGPARSGKSTAAAILQNVLGNYGAPMNENLLFGEKGNPEFVVSGIQGVRGLFFDEPPNNAQLNTPRLKALSGGDRVTGRAPYGREQITFEPECSLWLMTNHPLEIEDDAVWRRMKVFQFEKSLSAGAVDPRLRKAVVEDPTETGAALWWILTGAREWSTEGWGSTSVWTEAVDAERSSNDPLARWLAESLVITGVPTDQFDLSEMTTSFNTWLVMTGSDKPKLSGPALRDELFYRIRQTSVAWDKESKRFVGGSLE